ncbi:MAG: hypothetical protein EZS28_018621, partial [Streblomastix strix]
MDGSMTDPVELDAPTSCPSLCVHHQKTKKAGMDANQDHFKNASQFNDLSTLHTYIFGTNSSHAVDLPAEQLDLDVFQSDRQLAPTVAINALIQRATPLPIVYGQLVQILKCITRAPLQETDFYATNMSNTQVLEMKQGATQAPKLLQHTNILAVDRQLLPPLQTTDALAIGFYLQAPEFCELEPRQLSDNTVIYQLPVIKLEIKCLKCTRQFNWSKRLFKPSAPGETRNQQRAESEGNQTQRQNITARNSHYMMEIDMESEGRDINPTPLEAKINHASFIRQIDYWATKSYILKYFGKPGAGRHHPDSEEQSKEKDQSTAFWNNPRKRYRQEDRSNSKGNNQNFQTSVAPWLPTQPVPETTSNTVVPDLSKRQIGGRIPQFARTPDSSKSNKTPTPKQQSKQPTLTQGMDLNAKYEAQRLHNQMLTTIEKNQKRISDPYVTKNTEQSSEIFNETFNTASIQINILMTSVRFPLKIVKITPMIQMNIEYNETKITRAMMMYLEKLIQYSYKQESKKVKNERQKQTQSTISSITHFFQSSTYQGKYAIQVKSLSGQRRGKTGAANGTINPSAQSSDIKQITSGRDLNLGLRIDIEMEQMMERDLTQTQPTTNDGSIISTVPPQLWTAPWHAGRETASVFAAQHENIQLLKDGNEMNIPQQGHLEAQGAYGLGFQTMIDLMQIQSENESEQDQDQQDLSNLPDNLENESPSGLIQVTRRSDVNKSCIKTRPRSSCKKKKSHRQRQLNLRTAHADVCLKALTGGATSRNCSIEKLNPIRDRLPRMDMEYDRNEYFHDQRQKAPVNNIKETAALIGRLNSLKTQLREASLYLMLIDSVKTRAVKTQGWTGMMVSSLEILKELYRWIKKNSRKQEIIDIRPNSTSNCSNRYLTPRVGAKIQQDSGEVLVAHGAWLSYQIDWTSYRKELQAIHL